MNGLQLGLNLSHDSSATLTDSKGRIVVALGEERFSRKKNHWGIPRRAIHTMLSSNVGEVSRITIGSDLHLTDSHARRLVSSILENPSSAEGSILPYEIPGIFKESIKGDLNKYQLVEFAIRKLLISFNHDYKVEFDWVRHHEAHIGCAIGAQSSSKDSLLVSMDGMGDGESGAIFVNNSQVNLMKMASFSSLDSLGKLYSCVTKRYNFMPEKHEGKITGLAAFGNYSKAVELLASHVIVKDGVPRLRYLKGFKNIVTTRIFPELLGTAGLKASIQDIVDVAESQTSEYADLAYAVQKVLEESILEILRYWQKKTGMINLGLAGGVFANVRLNQRIAEEMEWNSVRIFPNMGDGGISAGAIWYNLARSNNLERDSILFGDMFLGYSSSVEEELDVRGVEKENTVIGESHKRIAELLANGFLVGIHDGRMEFGPRALGNRSILINPKSRDINNSVNMRLKRTEFMPFAPVVRAEKARELFELEGITDLWPFEFMTMTVRVKEEWREVFPGVVHIDGTARPQFVKDSDSLIYKILVEFEALTGIPALVNTSFNVHEEPINETLQSSIECLRKDAVDFVYSNGIIYSLKA